MTKRDKTRSVGALGTITAHGQDVETEHFGSYLKQRRQERGLSLADLSRATKIKEQSLELLEAARLAELPAPVFVRGFVSAYAREVGADQDDALRRYREHAAQCMPCEPEAAPDAPPQPLAVKSILDTLRGLEKGQPPPEKRRVGVVMVVLLILVVATLTLSLVLRHGGAAPGLS